MILREESISDEDKIVNIYFKTAKTKSVEESVDNKLNLNKVVKQPEEYPSDDDVLDFDPERDLV